MGKLNLIKSNFTGQVGAFTGQRYKGRNVIKSNEHKKRHPNTVQTKSVRAFECLNRMASSCVRDLWPYLGLSDRKQLKHNALASHWKPLIADHTFTPENLSRLYPLSDLEITSQINLVLDNENFTVIWNVPDYDPAEKEIYNAVIDSRGNVVYFGVLPTGQTTLNLVSNYYQVGDWIYCVSFVITYATATEKSKLEVTAGTLQEWEEGASFTLANTDITRNDTNYFVSLLASEPLPAGTNPVTIITHALSQAHYVDSTITGTLTTDGTANATLSFVPHKDTLNQKDMFMLDSNITIRRGSGTSTSGVFNWKKSVLAPKTDFDFSFEIELSEPVTTDGTSYTVPLGFTVPEGILPQWLELTFSYVTDNLTLGTAPAYAPGNQYFNTNKSAVIVVPTEKIVYGTSQTPNSEESGYFLFLTLDYDLFTWKIRLPSFPAMTNRIQRSAITGVSNATTYGPFGMTIRLNPVYADLNLGGGSATIAVTPESSNARIRATKTADGTSETIIEPLATLTITSGGSIVMYFDLNGSGTFSNTAFLADSAGEAEFTCRAFSGNYAFKNGLVLIYPFSAT